MNVRSVRLRHIVVIRCTRQAVMALLLFLACLQLKAQQKTYYGYLKDSAMGTAIVAASVSNKTTGAVVETDKNGFFAIAVTKGDLLHFSAPGYNFDTLRYFPYLRDTTHIELPRISTRLDVTVRSTTNMSKYQQDSMVRRDKFIADAGPKMRTFSKGNSGAGIGLNLSSIWGKKERQTRESYGAFDEREKQYYIDYRFSHEMVAYYTRLKGDSLNLFMGRYRPDYDWLRENPSQQDMLLYINEHLKLFFNRPD